LKPLLTAISLGLLLGSRPASAGLIAPLGSDGRLPFTVDAAVFPQSDGSQRVDFAVHFLHRNLEFYTHGQGRFTDLALGLKLARQGTVAADTTIAYTIRSDSDPARDPLRYSVLELSLRIPKGRWALTVRAQQLPHFDFEVWDFGLVKIWEPYEAPPIAWGHDESTASGVLDVARWEGRGPRMSDLEFRAPSGARGQKLPNVTRMYGIAQDTLEAYLELTDAIPGQRYAIDVEIYDPVHGGLDRDILELVPEAHQAAALYRLPMGTFPAGSYRIRLTPQWNPAMNLEAEFGVSWSMAAFLVDDRDVDVEGRLVFQMDQWDEFRSESRAGRLRMLQDFWAALDPTPGTVRNELYDQFQERLQHAERRYSAFGTHGALTDRGRVFVEFGSPADIEVEVVPLNGDQLDDTIGKVHDTYRLDRYGVAIKEQISIAHLELGERDSARNSARIGQEGSFELWSYKLNGDPLFSRGDLWTENVDLRFLFVDREGNGSYELEYSNTLLTH